MIELTTGDHDVEAWRDMFADLGLSRVRADDVIKVAINRGLLPLNQPSPPGLTPDYLNRLTALESAEAADTTDWRHEAVRVLDREVAQHARRAEIRALRALKGDTP